MPPRRPRAGGIMCLRWWPMSGGGSARRGCSSRCCTCWLCCCRVPGSAGRRPIALLISTVGVATVAVVGGLLVQKLAPGETIGLGLVGLEVVFAFCATGVALFMAAFVYAVLPHELLLVTGWPPEQTAAMFYLVGPFGQGASALQLLGDAETQDVNSQAVRAVSAGGTLPTRGAAQSLGVACILIALLEDGPHGTSLAE
ncbi:hypothetical protein B0T25DRAFT_531114 [Lasiosphaeria hispida]|uniref:Uncharacterized protein n=1 Tax=Lasiosphaeria hispida TaxID=260671 RepID=A0AAJ0HNY2_9PEZI|nr:hypothetical protein B0T25DRAFT_531114 [Lasiosphaeria hispida]